MEANRYPYNDPEADEWDEYDLDEYECPDCGAELYGDGRPCEFCGYDPLIGG